MPKRPVLHVINNLNVSGATTLLLDAARQMRPAPGELTICTLEPDNPMAGALEEAGAKMLCPWKQMNLASAVMWVRRAIREICPAIVHTHLLPATQIGLIAAKQAGKPVVTTVHFTFDHLRANLMLRQVNQISYRFYDRVFAISNAVRQSITENCRVAEGRLRVVRSGVDFSRILMPRQPDIRRSLSFADDDFVIGSVARLEELKGLQLLLDALAVLRPHFPHARVLLVGDGSYRAELEKKTQDLDLTGSVVFAGSRENPAQYYSAMDAFALPSLSEGLGLSLIEAMAAGLPSVGSTAGGIPEVITHGESGLLFEKGDANRLAECLDRLMRDKQLRQKLAAGGRQKAEADFAVEDYVRRLYAEYEALLQPSAALHEGAYA